MGNSLIFDRQKIDQDLLNINNHMDSTLTILNDCSLAMNLNPVVDKYVALFKSFGYEVPEGTFDYSNSISKMTYFDKDGNARPDGELKPNTFAIKARYAAEYFSLLADIFSLLDIYKDKYNIIK